MPHSSFPHHRPRAQQQALALEPQPDEVLAEAERLRLSRAHWWMQYRSLDELLADPQRARWFLILARSALRARWQQKKP